MRNSRAGRSHVASGVAIAIVVLTVATAHGAAQHRIDRAQVVRALINLEAQALDGGNWTYDRIQGRITLVDFWATWCAPCLRELPYLKRARAKYGDDFRVLGISLDRMSRRDLTNWLRRHSVGWPQIHANDGYSDAIAVDFGIDRLPTNLLLDRHGRVRALDVRGDDLFAEVDALIAESLVSE
ncbi:MAG TPA: TlpA disulfide reductase family protein [Acidobacteriota bacterium]|nr:TlpA disulfide reductase family protein [Acidobacteriota bacterium]